MIKLIARLAAVIAAAGALALAAAVPAGAASVPEGTFGTVAGDAFLVAVGPAAQIHPASAGFAAFGPQKGVSANASFALTEVTPGVFTIRWENGGHNQFGKYLVSDASNGVHFANVPDLWSFSGSQLSDISNGGRKLCLGAVPGGVSVVSPSSTAACTVVQIVLPS